MNLPSTKEEREFQHLSTNEYLDSLLRARTCPQYMESKLFGSTIYLQPLLAREEHPICEEKGHTSYCELEGLWMRLDRWMLVQIVPGTYGY